MQPGAVLGPLVVTADDTTGALESAARTADAGWDAIVIPFGTPAGTVLANGDRAGPVRRSITVDLRSRHAAPQHAAQRLTEVLAATASSVKVHKIDSTLRGNWPAEIQAALGAGKRVLMVPAYPSAGRVCRDGVVSEHGVPVGRSAHAGDPRSPVRTSRPAELLEGAEELASADHVATWLAGAGRVAVADAADDADVTTLVTMAAAHADVLLVGTAGVVGAAAQVMAASRSLSPRPLDATLEPRILVVNGSLHPVSRAQIDALLDAGAHMVTMPSDIGAQPVVVLTSSSTRLGTATDVAAMLGSIAHDVLRRMRAATVVLVGGDTAEAFIGDRVVRVAGSLDVGVAVGSVDIDGRTMTLVSKPGAFGGTNTLVDLMSDALTEGLRP